MVDYDDRPMYPCNIYGERVLYSRNDYKAYIMWLWDITAEQLRIDECAGRLAGVGLICNFHEAWTAEQWTEHYNQWNEKQWHDWNS